MQRTALTLFFSIQAIAGFSQQTDSTEEEVSIDPRQYVTIQYRKTPNQGKLDTIWNWEQRKNVPYQKFIYLDVDGEMKIDFSKNGLLKNKYFEGTISLEAEISGLNGTRRIEVNPYSEVGVQRIPIGIKSEPPAEIAKKLLNMLKELQNADSIFRSLYPGTSKVASLIRVKQNFYAAEANLKTDLEALSGDADASKYTSRVLNLGNMLSDVFGSFNPSISAKPKKGELLQLINMVDSKLSDEYRIEVDPFRDSYQRALGYAQAKVGNVIDYVSSFELAGEDANKAFLSLINRDLVNFKFLKTTLASFQKRITEINLQPYQNDPHAVDSVLYLNQNLIFETSKFLADIAQFQGSILETTIVGLPKYKLTRAEYYPTDSARQIYLKSFYDVIDKNRDELALLLSKEAGKVIYKKLVYATIDLGKSGAKNGEVLNVYITWILDSKRDSIGNSPRLPIGKYYLRETEIKMEVADMFALVKRVNESTVDQSKVSPSNFKGSGGAVLMWTYQKKDKGIEVTKNKNGEYEVSRKNRFLNFWEPSIGFNVSYLDFDTEKDVEIGTGLQLGLFRNKIFFGYGVNLHMISPSQAPTYFYVGFSFAKLSDLFKNSNNVTAVQ
ncbi:hypothetical protein [Pinibacter aurantiacus]|uniref:Uncharacterized protein n=1 Tax=Pinibacter aurantiacus TaxID=2851599 RepID=A0A9E2SBG4_9BACT|nr:hypothetical protein [Pinibacter aurantiacus]MBV4359916.1 hypothetical protein [Pinibacter aurantiacus]